MVNIYFNVISGSGSSDYYNQPLSKPSHLKLEMSLSPSKLNTIQRAAYRRDVLKLPGPIDRWLTTNSRSPNMSFLSEYLMMPDTRQQYVLCVVEVESSVWGSYVSS